MMQDRKDQDTTGEQKLPGIKVVIFQFLDHVDETQSRIQYIKLGGLSEAAYATSPMLGESMGRP